MRQHVDRLPPYSLESEMGALSCCLLDPVAAIPECVLTLPGSEAFYDLRHQTVYSLMVEMFDERKPIDLITITGELRSRGIIDEVGGSQYLFKIMDAAPSAANLSYYLEEVRNKYLLRRALNVCIKSADKVYESDGESAGQILDGLEADFLKFTQARAGKTEKDIKSFTRAALDRIEKRWQLKGAISGIATKYTDFDKITDGLQAGDMIVIAGRPSCGKTTWAMNIAENIAVDQKIPVGVFSLEMMGEQLVERMLCSRSKINLRCLGDGFLSELDMARLANSAPHISGAPLYIEDAGGLTIMQIRTKARAWYQQYGIKVLVVDYLQLIRGTSSENSGGNKHANRQQEVAEISIGLKNLAKELKIPVIALCQLNREIEKDKKRKPRLADLRESGAIEQDADVVAMLYPANSLKEKDDNPNPDVMPVNALIAKNRNGPRDIDVKMIFFKTTTRFETASKINTDD